MFKNFESCTWVFVYFIGVIETSVVPVYPLPRSNLWTDNHTVEVTVTSDFKVQKKPVLENFGFDTQESSNTSDYEDVFVSSERESCLAGQTIGACWKYKGLRFIQFLMQPLGVPTISNNSYARSFHEPQLVALPKRAGNITLIILGRTARFGLGDFYGFLERELARFLTRHGVVFTATTFGEVGDSENFQEPILLEEDGLKLQEGGRSTQRKVKRKSVLFPLLVLFKFFKIKMVLLPILLTVLLIKKLLVVALALAPSLLGFFRICRPGVPGFTPPFGLTNAGLLQEVSDSRGEFSTLYNTYASPYRDPNGYRNRQYGRYSSNAVSTQGDEPVPDY